jgi:hypothetical protein
MCLLRPWSTGFFINAIAELLSTNNVTALRGDEVSSDSNLLSQSAAAYMFTGLAMPMWDAAAYVQVVNKILLFMAFGFDFFVHICRTSQCPVVDIGQTWSRDLRVFVLWTSSASP